MPKIKKPTKADMSAMTGDTVALRKVRNQTVVSKIKIPRKSKSAKKKATNRKFKETLLEKIFSLTASQFACSKQPQRALSYSQD